MGMWNVDVHCTMYNVQCTFNVHKGIGGKQVKLSKSDPDPDSV